MKNIRRVPSGYLNEEYSRPAEPIVSNLVCSMLNYVSLFFTISYNVSWYYYVSSRIEDYDKNSSKSVECFEVYTWAHYITTWTILSLCKGVFFLFCSRLICGNENDCNILCLAIKGFTSLIPGFLFIFKIPSAVNSINTNTDTECAPLADALFKFYSWEYTYVLFVVFLVCFFAFAAIGMCFKELWKCRKLD